MSGVTRSDVARLVLRLGIGGVMVAHGSQKLFGWFGGGGLEGTSAFFESTGIKPGKPSALLAGVTETGGGVLLALGLATPSTAAAVASTMAVAVGTNAQRGFFAQQGGYEYPAVLGLSAAALGIAGAGKLSLDQLTGHKLAGRTLAIISIMGSASSTFAVLRRRHVELAPVVVPGQPGS